MLEPCAPNSEQKIALRGPENTEIYLKQYTPQHALFKWGKICSFCVPFDKIMWKVRAAQQYSAAKKHGNAARLLRSALVEDFAQWTHRGAETALHAYEPNVYAMYCRERGLAALATCKQWKNPSETLARLASYAAVMIGTACRLQHDERLQGMAHEAAGTAFDVLGEHFIKSHDAVGKAVGAFQQAQWFYDTSKLGSTCRLQWASERT